MSLDPREQRVPVVVQGLKARQVTQERAETPGREVILEITVRRENKAYPVPGDLTELRVSQDQRESKGRKEPPVIGVDLAMLE